MQQLQPTRASFGAPSDAELAEINRYALRALASEEVFTFTLTLCDNEVDRDFDRFSAEALEQLAPLFVGKSGIFDHAMRAKDQTARIYCTWVERDDTKKTRQGDAYTALKAKAYCLNTADNAAFIGQIEGGIRKEVSVSCSMGESVCTVCGKNQREETCSHIAGRFYRKNGKKTLCCHVLSQPLDAYEWSFVAVPAQRGAGVTKAFEAAVPPAEGDASALQEVETLRKEAQYVSDYRAALCKDIHRFAALCPPTAKAVLSPLLLDAMAVPELSALRDELEKTARQSICALQLAVRDKAKTPDAASDGTFRI